jgi:hypothetical protein
VPATNLGAACAADAECGMGLTCLKSTDNLSADPTSPGGPGKGLCTMDCTMDASVCGPVGGICVAIDIAGTGDAATVTRALCLETCTVGPPLPMPAVRKCHGRGEVTCEPVNRAETLFACIPLCISDADCSGGRKCEAASGLCVTTPHTGKPLGSGCTVVVGQSNTECESGLCLLIDDLPDGGTMAPGVCSEFCQFRNREACHYRITPIDAGPPMGACVLPYNSMGGYNAGDLGLCLQLCDGPNDCAYKAANWVCRTDITLRDWGHSVCLPPDPG